MANEVTKKLRNNQNFEHCYAVVVNCSKTENTNHFFLVLVHKIFAVTSAYFRPRGIKLL